MIAFGVFIIFSYSSSSTDRSMVMPDEGVGSGWMMFPLLACSTSGQRFNYPFSSLNPTTQQFNNCVAGFLELWKVQTGRQHGAVPLRYHAARVAPAHPSSVSSSTVRSRMVVTEALGIGLHSSSVQRALHGGWKLTAHVLMLAWAGHACRSTAFAVAKARGSTSSMSLRTESVSGHSWLRRSIPVNSLRTLLWCAPHVPPKSARLEMTL